MRMTGTFDSLAYLRSLAAHSLTWLTLPAADSRSSEAMVCIESMTMMPGLDEPAAEDAVELFAGKMDARVVGGDDTVDGLCDAASGF